MNKDDGRLVSFNVVVDLDQCVIVNFDISKIKYDQKTNKLAITFDIYFGYPLRYLATQLKNVAVCVL